MNIPGFCYMRAGGVSIVLDLTTPFLPRIVHWGADLGELTDAGLGQLAVASQRQVATNQPDEVPWLSLMPENAHAWAGTPGLEGHRDGRDFSTRFEVKACSVTVVDGTHRVCVEAVDEAARLGLLVEIELMPSGLARQRATLTNQADDVYTLDGLTLAWPVPQQATELLDFAGRHGRERWPQPHQFTQGTYMREGRHGRTGADATLLLLAGEAGFNFRHGEVWGVHTAWSGNHRTLAERLSSTESILAGGEVLLPGEVRLAAGQQYASPWLYAAYGQGIDEVSARFHRFMRTRRNAPRHPRPVTGNSWEAVYFQQDPGKLSELAEAFAEVGVERFVLDDGWFTHRHDDRAGLGDWYVDPARWPEGLHPLVDHVRALGMQFGLWVEPEMINVDSDLARAHPDWILAAGGRLPPEWRHQQVLNLGNPGAYAYIRARMDALIGEYGLTYLKWDHNRDLIEAGDQATGRAGVHAQTLAAYALIDELKAAHPGLDIESCSSGGSRCDLEIMCHTDRMWASDCTDAHERQQIQRYTGLILPPEMIGAHISADENHQTRRRLSLAMRAATALFGDLGVEWDITAADEESRAELAAWIVLYKQWRWLLHSGDVVHLDQPDPALWVHGVVAPDRSQALFAAVFMATSQYAPPGLVRLEGLDPDRVYHLDVLPISRPIVEHHYLTPPPWWNDGVTMPGRVLKQVGFQLPDLPPDAPLVLAVTDVLRHTTP